MQAVRGLTLTVEQRTISALHSATWSSCVTNTTAPHDHRSKSTFTGKGSL
jgi:hypothetical protein